MKICSAFLVLISWGLDVNCIVVQWCNPLTLQPEKSGGQNLIPGRAPSLERHDKGLKKFLNFLFCKESSEITPKLCWFQPQNKNKGRRATPVGSFDLFATRFQTRLAHENNGCLLKLVFTTRFSRKQSHGTKADIMSWKHRGGRNWSCGTFRLEIHVGKLHFCYYFFLLSRLFSKVIIPLISSQRLWYRHAA